MGALFWRRKEREYAMNTRIAASSKEALQAEHRALDLRLRQLGKRPHPTTAEQMEAIELKKRKLLMKDALTALSNHRD